MLRDLKTRKTQATIVLEAIISLMLLDKNSELMTEKLLNFVKVLKST